MKKYYSNLISGIFIFVIVIFTSCSKKEEPKKPYFLAVPEIKAPEEPQRIKLIYHNSNKYYSNNLNSTYEIIEVDGHLYLSMYQGGIIHLESCPCKTKK